MIEGLAYISTKCTLNVPPCHSKMLQLLVPCSKKFIPAKRLITSLIIEYNLVPITIIYTYQVTCVSETRKETSLFVHIHSNFKFVSIAVNFCYSKYEA